eukprot:INCI6213.2.p1 GENE.INCI6213.2~~INCI6213.2.p1  ORF type:complete len:577 (-),score=106.97 INCI6213.2:212-1942(-)
MSNMGSPTNSANSGSSRPSSPAGATGSSSASATTAAAASSSVTAAADGHGNLRRTSSSPEQIFKDFKGLFQKKKGEGAKSSSSGSSGSASNRASRRTSLLGPWIQNKSSVGNRGGGGAGGAAAVDSFDENRASGGKSGSDAGGRGSHTRSNRIMSSRYWGGQYRVCTNPSVLRKHLSTVEDGEYNDYVKNEVIGRVPIRAWVQIAGFCDITSTAHLMVVSRALREVANHTVLRQLGRIVTLDGERDLLEVISHPKQSCAEDLWLLQFFDPIQIELQKRSLQTAQMLQDLQSCVCIEDVVEVLRALQEHTQINFSMAKFHEAITAIKRNFDALGRDEWRVQVQPVLANVVRDCRFAAKRPPAPLELFETVQNSQTKNTLFKKKEEVKCNGSVWDGHDSEFMFTYFEGGTGELWHWPVENKKAKLVSSMKLGNQRPTGAAMGQTKKRFIAYGAQFQSTISVMRAHNSDWTRVPKTLDASRTSSLVEVINLTGHEGYVSSVQFLAQDRCVPAASSLSIACRPMVVCVCFGCVCVLCVCVCFLCVCVCFLCVFGGGCVCLCGGACRCVFGPWCARWWWMM